ncbi:MAG: RNA-binding protein [Pseudomonadota bacterium]
MPKGPQGQKRPADAIGAAIMVAKIATGEVEEVLTKKSGRSRSGKAGGKGRADSLTQEARSKIAKKAAMARWER